MSRGAGNTSCGTYIEFRTSGNMQSTSQVVQWVWGSLHGYNLYTPNAAKVSPPELDAVAAYLEKYCRENPLGYVVNALPKLVDDLGGVGAPTNGKR